MSGRRKREGRSSGEGRPVGVRPVGRAYAQVREQVLERDQMVCQRCRRVLVRQVGRGVPQSHAATVDHVIPVLRGGWDDPVNLQALCLACNTWKGNRVMDFRVPELRAALRAERARRSALEGVEVGAWVPRRAPYGPYGRDARVLTVRLPRDVAQAALEVHPVASELLRAVVEALVEVNLN